MYGIYNNQYSNINYHGPSSPYGHGLASSSGGPSPMQQIDETAAVALLQHLSKTELQNLLNDDSKLTDIINDLSQVRSLQSDHDDLVARNKSLAEYNLSQQPRLDSLKTEVATLYERANKLKTELGEEKCKLDSFAGSQKLETMHALLQTEAAKSEEESELFVESFYNKSLSVEDFLAQFLPERTKAHLRRVKAEKMGELLRNGGLSGHMPSSWTSPAHAPLFSTPYPLGPPAGASAFSVSGGVPYMMPQPNFYRQ
ncbi:vacuolar protein sorting-associated protein 37B-like isoform X2 [Pomacea canaliculata]|nr:vacuolar protein sorting-associated protein 37B-like isoform X2 [Pomacea canaliculata]